MVCGVPKSLSGFPQLISYFWIGFAAFSILFGSYLVSELGGLLVLRPQMIWPVWPGCAFLAAVLLLVPRKTWPIFLTAGIAGFILYDLHARLAIGFIALLNLADVVEILTVAFGVRYALGGIPRMNSLASLAKYSFFAVILAPIFAASIGAVAYTGGYEARWKISFLTEALALLTLTPAVLSWVDVIRTRANRSPTYYLELFALLVALLSVAYSTFLSPGGSNRPTLLYSLVPFLLWSALRFGIMGVSSSLSIV